MRTVEAGSHRGIVPLAIVACLAPLWAPPAAAQSITDLGTLLPAAINASGQIVGGSILYSNGVVTNLGALPGDTLSQATAINASGQVAGLSYIAGNAYGHAFLYSGGVMTDLGTLGGSYSQASGINASGHVVGSAYTRGGFQHAFLYSGGVMTDLGTLGGSYSQASGINASGQVVGSSTLAGAALSHAFLYSGGVMTDLGAPSGSQSWAFGINDIGQVVGNTNEADAFIYSGGVMTDLGPGSANGINASGQVVGFAYPAGGLHYAFLYSNGLMTDLNSLLAANPGWALWEADAINDSGQIVGLGIIDGTFHGFLLNLIGLSPSSAAPGGAAFTLTVTGTGFVPGATVNWNGAPLATAYVSPTQVTASVPANLIAVAGTASVTVPPTDGTPVAATFGIHPARASPGVPERPRGTAPVEQQ